MNGAFHIGAVGLDAQRVALEAVAGNITNLATPGYKRTGIRFDALAAEPRQGAAPAGVRAEASERVFDQGELRTTGRALDVAIDGAGFIELADVGGRTLLWRGGGLKVDDDGFLAADNGRQLAARIAVPDGTTALLIAPDGRVTGLPAGEGERRELGVIELVTIRDPASLNAADDGLFAADEATVSRSAAAGEDGAGTLVQGAVEGSNVVLTDEMVALMLVQRAYAASARVVQAGDEMMAVINGLKR